MTPWAAGRVTFFLRSRFHLMTALLQSTVRDRKNPLVQPHILFLLRQKENVPLTVQEKKAAGGAVKGRSALPRPPC